MQLLKRIFKKKPPSSDMKKFLIVGLGNIGLEYDNTRHNVGFKILDHVAKKDKALWEVKKLASYSSFKKKGKKFVMIKPTTFMNRSGKSVKYWALKEKINIENILIITDDLHLPFGTLRLRGKGSAAGHNGLKDIESELNTPNYARLRFGIGQQNKPFDQVKFVLDKWNKNEEKDITKRIDICKEIVIAFGLEGLNNTMNKFNGK
ncbi:MAG: aminoacyl-tRNA hydrolase [Flavobacteriaceae bacterium TMED208]|nr:MAG: aminoacyl-tRNA hydrolase [Flavobacteriaceae bacterium TMED208]